MLTSAFGAREPNSCTNHIHLFFKSKNETVSRGGFHWIITHPGVGVFLGFFLRKRKTHQCTSWPPHRSICLLCDVARAIKCLRALNVSEIYYAFVLCLFLCVVCCFKPFCLHLLYTFFLALVFFVFALLIPPGFCLVYPPPCFICCLGIEYTMHYNFCFCYAFLPTLCIFSTIITCYCFCLLCYLCFVAVLFGLVPCVSPSSYFAVWVVGILIVKCLYYVIWLHRFPFVCCFYCWFFVVWFFLTFCRRWHVCLHIVFPAH